MKSRHSSTVSFLVLCVHVVMILSGTSTEARIKIPANKTVPAVIVFGDSIMDTGNNNNNVLSLARSNFPPYGRDFKGGKPTGRYSNGKVPSDLIGGGHELESVSWWQDYGATIRFYATKK